MTMNHNFPPLPAALAALLLLALPACSNEGATEPSGMEETNDTLAAAIADADGMSTVAKALDDSGLSQVFDGAGSYTLFAPNDAAFDALGETGDALRQPDQRAAMAAVLRDHIVAGYLTPDDIKTAIDAQGGRAVEVETMGDHKLMFSLAGEDIKVTGEDGTSALLTGASVRASNGVAIALDTVLKRFDAPQA
jgi:uncharacterized surface protein with fasciclin (FAS1) repeats